MKRPKIIGLKKFLNNRGALIPITFDKKFPIKVKRFFLIYGNKKFTRGDHAHKKCSQILYPVLGKFIISVVFNNRKKKYILDSKKIKSLLLPPKTWCSIKFLNQKSSLLVLTDYEYDFKDYIETFDDFLKFTNKKK